MYFLFVNFCFVLFIYWLVFYQLSDWRFTNLAIGESPIKKLVFYQFSILILVFESWCFTNILALDRVFNLWYNEIDGAICQRYGNGNASISQVGSVAVIFIL